MLTSAAARIPAHKLRCTLAYVDEHIAGDLRVESLARLVAMSAFHFAHAFRDATGTPPHRYVVERRIERAKSLLRDTGLTLDEIAHRVGYSCRSHFSVAFRKTAGVSPSAFRRRTEARAKSQLCERARKGIHPAPA